jgi:hypothetical protein
MVSGIAVGGEFSHSPGFVHGNLRLTVLAAAELEKMGEGPIHWTIDTGHPTYFENGDIFAFTLILDDFVVSLTRDQVAFKVCDGQTAARRISEVDHTGNRNFDHPSQKL